MKRYALIGVGGYIAPRHMEAIKKTGGDLVAALDPNDSVGIIDSYFPNAHFFREFEIFDRHVDKLHRSKEPIDYVSICSPNFLHDAHIRFALRSRAVPICEKPLVLNPWNLEALEVVEQEQGLKVNCILQLRLHEAIVALKKQVEAEPAGKIHEVELTYITPRGRWYQNSWKGDIAKSGGVATNIGIHFFDMLMFLFGPAAKSVVHLHDAYRSAGYIELERARIRWFLSIEGKDVPAGSTGPYRSITVDGKEIEFSKGFTDLHTESYKRILSGEGFGISHVRPSIELAAQIRNATPAPQEGKLHPLVKNFL